MDAQTAPGQQKAPREPCPVNCLRTGEQVTAASTKGREADPDWKGASCHSYGDKWLPGKTGVKSPYWRKPGGGDSRAELLSGSWLSY